MVCHSRCTACLRYHIAQGPDPTDDRTNYAQTKRQVSKHQNHQRSCSQPERPEETSNRPGLRDGLHRPQHISARPPLGHRLPHQRTANRQTRRTPAQSHRLAHAMEWHNPRNDARCRPRGHYTIRLTSGASPAIRHRRRAHCDRGTRAAQRLRSTGHRAWECS